MSQHLREKASLSQQTAVPNQTKRRLSAPRQALVELLQALNFGSIKGLLIRNGEPVLDPLPHLVESIKFGAANGPRPERWATDFALKAPVVKLFAYLDRVRDCVIESLEVRDGLPYTMDAVRTIP